MKVLFDNNVPVYLARLFTDHEVSTAFRQGWASLQNGKLLAAAEDAGFELFVTMDKNMRHQQNIQGRRLCIAVLYPQGQEREDTVLVGQSLVSKLGFVRPGTVLLVSTTEI